MLPKTSIYVKRYDGQTKWCIFWLIMMTYYKNIILLEIKSVLILKKNCLTVISLASALKKEENYYLQVFLKECKHIEKKVIRHIVDNLSGFCSSSEEFAEE